MLEIENLIEEEMFVTKKETRIIGIRYNGIQYIIS